MLCTDLAELKSIMGIPVGNKAQDKRLNFLIEQASSWIEELLGRDFSYKARTQYYDGHGTDKIRLRNRPVYPSPVPRVFVDEDGNYGATSGAFDVSTTEYDYGDDFTIQWDQDDGTSRSALLIRIGDSWPIKRIRTTGLLSPSLEWSLGSVKVIYTAGYTVDNLPPVFRWSCNTLVSRMNAVAPWGMEVQGGSFEELSINTIAPQKDYMLALIKPALWNYRNWSF